MALAALALLLAGPPAVADAVSIHLRLDARPHGTRAERDRVRDLEYELMARAAAVDPGARVRDAWPDGECILAIEARDGGAMWRAVEDAVRAWGARPGSYALVREGPGAAVTRIELGK